MLAVSTRAVYRREGQLGGTPVLDSRRCSGCPVRCGPPPFAERSTDMTRSDRRRVHAVTMTASEHSVSTVQTFARVWAAAIAGTSYVPISGDEVVELLGELTGEL